MWEPYQRQMRRPDTGAPRGGLRGSPIYRLVVRGVRVGRMIGTVLQTDLEELIKSRDWNCLREVMEELPPPDIAEIISDLPPEDQGVIFRTLPRERAAQVFAYLPLEHQRQLVQSLSNATVQGILNEMSPDDRTRLLEELPAAATRRLLETLSPDELRAARTLLGYPEGTA